MPDLLKWTCRKCRAVNTPDFTHCHACGEHNPALPEHERACPRCGLRTTRDYCPRCDSPMSSNL